MSKNKLYVCFSKKRALKLRQMGCMIEKLDINIKNPQYYVYYFKWDSHLDECIKKIEEEKK